MIALPSVNACESCHGSGHMESTTCDQCGGLGTVAIVDGFILYFDPHFDRPARRVEVLQKVFDFVVNGCAGLLVVLGLGLLARLIWQSPSPWDVFDLAFWTVISWELRAFWVAVLAAAFLYYRFGVAAARRPSLPDPRREAKRPPLPPMTPGNVWQGWRQLPRRQRRDAATGYTPETLKIIREAFKAAERLKSAELSPLHILAASLGNKEVSGLFLRLGVTGETFRPKYASAVARLAQGSEPVMNSAMHRVFLGAWLDAYRNRLPVVSPAELLFAAVQSDPLTQELLLEFGIDLPKLEHAVAWLRVNRRLHERYQHYFRSAALKPKGTMDRAMTAVATPDLDRMSSDLTSLAARGYTEMAIGRDEVLKNVFRAIEGGRKSVVLVGPHGVGKDVVLDMIAQYMVEEEVPRPLRDKRLVSLRLADLVSGASPSEAQARLLTVLDEIARAGNIVLAVPHVASAVGIAAGQGGALDLGDVLADELARGYCFAIGTASPEEYRAMERTRLGQSLVRVDVPPLGIDDTIRVLEAKAGPLEAKHGVWFSYDALEAAAQLSERYLHDVAMPEQAMEALREAASAAATRQPGTIVTREDVAGVVSSKTGVPLGNLTAAESAHLLNLEADMHGRVVGQDEAVSAVAGAMRRAGAGVRDRNRPIANFLFLGPTGVGKTELAKTLAEKYFGDEAAMVRLDMSEYQDKAAIAKLIGESGGAAGGQLTEALRRKPFSLILLDEIEKAHPDLLTLFLQVMDDGRLTDNVGRTVSFGEAIIIMTSNAGADFIQDSVRAGTPVPAIKEGLLREKLRGIFRPEFLNRFDDVVVFRPLDQGDVLQIARLMLKKAGKRLAEKGIGLEVTDAAVRELAAAGFDPAFGARPLRRVIQDRVDNAVADLLLRNQVARRDRIVIDVGGAVKVVKGEHL
jgi:ATP-dependent Clp protease ATP-binding subunit ClpC